MGCEKERRRLQRQRTKKGFNARRGTATARREPRRDEGLRGCAAVREGLAGAEVAGSGRSSCREAWAEVCGGWVGARGLNGAALVSAPAGLRARDWGGSG